MKDRTLHLKIKIKSLVAEAKIIKQEAKKVSGDSKYLLKAHNRNVVRPVTRRNLLAYGLIRNIPYSKMEQKCEIKPDLDKVVELAKRFGCRDADQITTWIEEAKKHLKEQKRN